MYNVIRHTKGVYARSKPIIEQWFEMANDNDV